MGFWRGDGVEGRDVAIGLLVVAALSVVCQNRDLRDLGIFRMGWVVEVGWGDKIEELHGALRCGTC